MNTLVLNLDDRLKRRLDALAAHHHKPLPDWAAEQLGRLAADAGEIPVTTFSAEWLAAFGSIDDPSFSAPERVLPSAVEPLDAGRRISALFPERWIHPAREACGGLDDHGTRRNGMFGSQNMR